MRQETGGIKDTARNMRQETQETYTRERDWSKRLKKETRARDLRNMRQETGGIKDTRKMRHGKEIRERDSR